MVVFRTFDECGARRAVEAAPGFLHGVVVCPAPRHQVGDALLDVEGEFVRGFAGGIAATPTSEREESSPAHHAPVAPRMSCRAAT